MQPCISVVKLSLLLLLYMLRSTFLNALCWQKSQGADRSNYEQRTWPARLSDWWSRHVRDDDSWQQGRHCNRQGRRDDQTLTSNCDFIAVNDCLYCCVALETCISTDVTVFYFIHIRLKLILTEIAVYGLSAIFTFVLNCSCHNTLWVASKTSVFNETGRLSANRRHHLLVIWLLRYHIHYRYGQFLYVVLMPLQTFCFVEFISSYDKTNCVSLDVAHVGRCW